MSEYTNKLSRSLHAEAIRLAALARRCEQAAKALETPRQPVKRPKERVRG